MFDYFNSGNVFVFFLGFFMSIVILSVVYFCAKGLIKTPDVSCLCADSSIVSSRYYSSSASSEPVFCSCRGYSNDDHN